MAGTIKITPQELRDGASFLGEKLSAMSSEATALKGRLDTIASNWEGASQSAFMAGFNEDMWPVLNVKLPELINAIQKQLTETARVLEDTDDNISKSLRA